MSTSLKTLAVLIGLVSIVAASVLLDSELVVNALWMLAWSIALGVGCWQLDVVRGDWRAVVEHGIGNGRRIIARGNLRTMWLLVGVTVLNLVPGIISIWLRPAGIMSADTALLLNRIALLLSAWLVTAIILGKRHDRIRWEARYHPRPHLGDSR